MNLQNKSDIFPVTFIAVDGRGGAGKTTLANELAAALGVSVVHTDDFTAFDRPAYDGADLVIEKVFAPIQRGEKTLSYGRLQIWPGEPDKVVDQPVTDVMVIEGCGVSCAKFRPYLSYVIVAELEDDERNRRLITRDVNQGGRSPEENDRIGKLWGEKEEEYFAHDDPRKRSDLIVNSREAFDISGIITELQS